MPKREARIPFLVSPCCLNQVVLPVSSMSHYLFASSHGPLRTLLSLPFNMIRCTSLSSSDGPLYGCPVPCVSSWCVVDRSCLVCKPLTYFSWVALLQTSLIDRGAYSVFEVPFER